MGYWKNFFGHLKTILAHKKWVLYYMYKMGYPVRGLFHDISKFSPVEFFEGVKFWDGKRSPINVAKEKIGMSYAWLHHKGRNKHHYEYWIDKIDIGGQPYNIPFKYLMELVCDWFAAATTYDGANPGEVFVKEYDWWCEKKKTAKINSYTKEMIDKILWNFREFYLTYLNECNGDTRRAERKTLKTIRGFVTGWKHEYENGKDY